jgi:hypothetical protein
MGPFPEESKRENSPKRVLSCEVFLGLSRECLARDRALLKFAQLNLEELKSRFARRDRLFQCKVG